jgi:hypothetical protein
VARPAGALTAIGGLAGALAAVHLVSSLFGGIVLLGPGAGIDAQNKDRPVSLIRPVGGVVQGMIGVAWGTVVYVGGYQMKTLRSRGWAMAGSIVALIPISVCCVPCIPFGIWALVTIGRPEVVDAFGRVSISE